MPDYYLSQINLNTGLKFKLDKAEFNHAKVNRKLKSGGILNIKDPNKNIFKCTIIECNRKEAHLIAGEKLFISPQLNSGLTVCIAYIKEKNLSIVLQKTTELNVEKIIIFVAKRSQAGHKFDEILKKSPRWQKIIQEAAKQSGRLDAPQLMMMENLPKVIEKITPEIGIIYLTDKNAPQRSPSDVEKLEKKAVFIGPEGGFDQEEVAILEKAGAKKITLGTLTLRSETAAIAASALLGGG